MARPQQDWRELRDGKTQVDLDLNLPKKTDDTLDPNARGFGGESNETKAQYLLLKVETLASELNAWGSLLIPSVKILIVRDGAGTMYIPFDPKTDFSYIGDGMYDHKLPMKTRAASWVNNTNYSRGTHAINTILRTERLKKKIDTETQGRLQTFLDDDKKKIHDDRAGTR
jgi:hypothetical protein